MAGKIRINDHISLAPGELRYYATRASGPGGQKVNKTATRITLRFSLAESSSFGPEDKRAIKEKLGKLVSESGDIVIHEERGRTQGINRKLALEKFRKLIAGALLRPRRRIPTSASPAEREKRLREKKHTGEKKRERKRTGPSDTDF